MVKSVWGGLPMLALSYRPHLLAASSTKNTAGAAANTRGAIRNLEVGNQAKEDDLGRDD